MHIYLSRDDGRITIEISISSGSAVDWCIEWMHAWISRLQFPPNKKSSSSNNNKINNQLEKIHTISSLHCTHTHHWRRFSNGIQLRTFCIQILSTGWISRKKNTKNAKDALFIYIHKFSLRLMWKKNSVQTKTEIWAGEKVKEAQQNLQSSKYTLHHRHSHSSWVNFNTHINSVVKVHCVYRKCAEREI